MGDEVQEIPVSVVIPAYRRPEMTERALRSVLVQAPRPREILVVDDASGDDTGPRAAALGATVIRHEHNLGESGARNTGLQAARGEWIALLDSDDEWLPGHLATLWAARGGHCLIGTLAWGVGEGPGAGRVLGFPGPRPAVLRSPAAALLPQNKFTSSSVLLRRDVAERVGGFAVGMPRAADLDMWLRVLEHGSGLALPRVTALYHRHPEQVSADAPRMWQAHREVLDAYRGRPWLRASVVRRHEGVVAWDRMRRALAGGEGWPALGRFLLAVRHPQRLRGVLELLLERRRARRLSARLRLTGGLP